MDKVSIIIGSKSDNFGEDPYGETSPENLLKYLQA